MASLALAQSRVSMQRSLIRRFHPSAHSPREALVRATETPREIRAFAEAAIEWSLIQLFADLAAPAGNLPCEFGFRQLRSDEELRESPLAIGLSNYATLIVAPTAFWSVNADRSGVFLRASRFVPMKLVNARHAIDDRTPGAAAQQCRQPIDWVLAWAHVAACVRRLAEYERWAQRRAPNSRRGGDRPRGARKAGLAAHELPAALDAVAEWAADGEQAMLAWIVADAKWRCADPHRPA
jgi:hypothetical protein